MGSKLAQCLLARDVKNEALIKLCAVVTATALALAAAEFIVRRLRLSPTVFRFGISTSESVYQTSENQTLGYTLKPNFRSDNTNCHQFFPFTNSHGQRDLERTHERPVNVQTRILILGDSVVAGSGVCDFEEILSRQLEQRLMPEHFEVLNFGVPGYCTLAEVELLRERGLAFGPDEVLLTYVWNDFVDANSLVVDREAQPRPEVIEELFHSSHLFRLLSLHLNLYRFADEYTPDQKKAAEGYRVKSNNRIEGFDLLKNLALQHGFKVSIVAWPHFTDRGFEEPEVAYVVPMSERISLDEEAKRRGFEVIRLTEHFREDFEIRRRQPRKRPASPRWVYTIGDGTHPNRLGAEIAAAALTEKFLAAKTARSK